MLSTEIFDKLFGEIVLILFQSALWITNKDGSRRAGPAAAREPGWRTAADRSYPTSEVRGSGSECQAAMVQERRRGATLRPRSVAARRSYPAPKARAGDLREPP